MKQATKKETKVVRKRVVLNISDEDFIRSYQTAKNAGDVASQFGITVGQVHRKAMFMRKHSVPLKAMRRGRNKDWTKAIELARTMLIS